MAEEYKTECSLSVQSRQNPVMVSWPTVVTINQVKNDCCIGKYRNQKQMAGNPFGRVDENLRKDVGKTKP